MRVLMLMPALQLRLACHLKLASQAGHVGSAALQATGVSTLRRRCQLLAAVSQTRCVRLTAHRPLAASVVGVHHLQLCMRRRCMQLRWLRLLQRGQGQRQLLAAVVAVAAATRHQHQPVIALAAHGEQQQPLAKGAAMAVAAAVVLLSC